MNEPPADWYVADLLDAAANRLERDPDCVDLVRRLRYESAALRQLERL